MSYNNSILYLKINKDIIYLCTNYNCVFTMYKLWIQNQITKYRSCKPNSFSIFFIDKQINIDMYYVFKVILKFDNWF